MQNACSDTFPGGPTGLSALGQFGGGPFCPHGSGAPCHPLADSQGPHQPGRQQKLQALDDHSGDGPGPGSPDVGAQPPTERKTAALQVHPPLNGLIWAQSSKAARVVADYSVSPGTDAAGGREAAGLGPCGAAVKGPAREHGASVQRAEPTIPGPGAEERSLTDPPNVHGHTQTHTHTCAYTTASFR